MTRKKMVHRSTKCKYFAVFNSQLEADKSFNIPGLDKIPMRELTSFTN